MSKSTNLARHVTFCVGADYYTRGSQGEDATVQFLLDHLDPSVVGDYRILVNYNIPALGADLREIDVLVINRFGVFLLEVKNWLGNIEAHDDGWYVRNKNQGNVLITLKRKVSILHSWFFGPSGKLSDLRDVSVAGLIVLVRGLDRFSNESNYDSKAIFDLSNRQLINALSSTQLLFYKSQSRRLSDQDILRVRTALYKEHAPSETMAGKYRILKEIAFGDAFVAYEAEDSNVPGRRVRLKRYEMPTLSPERMAALENHFKRNIKAVSPLSSHPNILHSYDFFPGPEGPHVFYEVTELVGGNRLDEIIARADRPLTLEEQLRYLEPLCIALHASHTYRTPEGTLSPIYHRNVSPAVVYVARDGTVKLGDFDFAKLRDKTIFVPGGAELYETAFVPPELLSTPSRVRSASDIYSLGVLWFYLASLPTQKPPFDRRHPDLAVDQLNLPVPARALMKRMMAYALDNRPQSMEEVLRDLKALRANA